MSLVRTLESEGIREDSYRVDEVDAVFGEVRFPPRLVPLEHVTGPYGISVGLVNAPIDAERRSPSSPRTTAAWLSTDTLGGTRPRAYGVLVARSTNGGPTWSFPYPVESGTPGGAAHTNMPWLASDGAGRWLLAMQGTSLQIKVSATYDDGRSWSSPSTVSSWSGWNPVVTDRAANDRAGTWLVTWNARFGDLDRPTRRRSRPDRVTAAARGCRLSRAASGREGVPGDKLTVAAGTSR